MVLLAGDTVNVANAIGVTSCISAHLVDHGIGADGQVAGCQSWRQ